MKSPKQYIGFALLVFLGGMMSSCVKEKIGEKQGNAVVDLTFHTRSESDVNAMVRMMHLLPIMRISKLSGLLLLMAPIRFLKIFMMKICQRAESQNINYVL